MNENATRLARLLDMTEMWAEFDRCARVHLLAQLQVGMGRVWARATYAGERVVIGGIW